MFDIKQLLNYNSNMKELDNLHYDFRAIDGYNKPFNFIMSPRELGKTTMFWLKKAYLKWKENKKPWIYTVRHAVEITQALIDSIADTTINKFTDDNVKFTYTKGSFKDGIVDIFIGKDLFFRIVSLSISLQRIKKAVLKNIAGVITDEYIVNPKLNEKYLKGEATIIKEAYTTWRREAEGVLKWYIFGNPYSLYNPLFLYWKVDTNKIKLNDFYVGETYVLHTPTLSEELKNKLLEENPLYKFDEDYRMYALLGKAMNDRNIKLGVLPQNYSLKFTFKMEDLFIGVFQCNEYKEGEDKFFCKFIDTVSAKRVVYCFDFESMIERCQLLALDDRFKLQRFKDAMRKRLVSFEDINVYYKVQEVYEVI